MRKRKDWVLFDRLTLIFQIALLAAQASLLLGTISSRYHILLKD